MRVVNENLVNENYRTSGKDWSMKIRIRWADVIALGIVSLMIIGGMLWIFIAASDAVMDRLPPCAAEDSDNCHWDASSSGNGTGESFYVIDGDIHYLP